MGDLGSIPGLERSPGEGKGYPLQYSGLENSMGYSPWGHKELDIAEWLSLHIKARNPKAKYQQDWFLLRVSLLGLACGWLSFSGCLHIVFPVFWVLISSSYRDTSYIGLGPRVCLVAQLVKNLPAMQEAWFRTLGWENPLEKGKATHSSILAWRIPWTV